MKAQGRWEGLGVGCCGGGRHLCSLLARALSPRFRKLLSSWELLIKVLKVPEERIAADLRQGYHASSVLFPRGRDVWIFLGFLILGWKDSLEAAHWAVQWMQKKVNAQFRSWFYLEGE